MNIKDELQKLADKFDQRSTAADSMALLYKREGQPNLYHMYDGRGYAYCQAMAEVKSLLSRLNEEDGTTTLLIESFSSGGFGVGKR